MGAVDDGGGDRRVEYYETVVELSAAIILRGAGGWEILSAGRVAEGVYWAEYERTPGAVR